MKDTKVLCEEKWRNGTQSVWCFTLDAVDPGYLARRPHCILSFPRECRHFYVQEKQSSRETGAQNQLEHTHPPLASFSSPCPSPESKTSCWGESSILIYFIFFFKYKALFSWQSACLSFLSTRITECSTTRTLDFISLFCSIQIVLLGVGSHSLLKVEGEKWIGRIACYVDQLKNAWPGCGRL